MSILTAGCRQVGETVYSEFLRVPDSWSRWETMTFRPTPADTATIREHSYDLALDLRYLEREAPRRVRLVVETEREYGDAHCDTLILNLADRRDENIRRSRGLCEVSDTILRNQRYTVPPTVRVYPLMPASATRGLLNVGITMSINDKDRKR